MAAEQARIRAIDRQLAKLRTRYVRVYSRWEKLNIERRELDAAAHKLLEERNTLAQGQLMFSYPQRGRRRRRT